MIKEPEKFLKALKCYESGVDKCLEDGTVTAEEIDRVRLAQYLKDLEQGQRAHQSLAESRADEVFLKGSGGDNPTWLEARENFKSVVYDGLEAAVKMHRIMKLYDVLS